MPDLYPSTKRLPMVIHNLIPDAVCHIATAQGIPAGQAPRGQYFQTDYYQDACWYTKNHYKDSDLREGSASITTTTRFGDLSGKIELDHLVFQVKRAENSGYYAVVSFGLKLCTYAPDSKRLAMLDISKNIPDRGWVRCVDLASDGETVFISNRDTLRWLDRNLKIVNTWKTPSNKIQETNRREIPIIRPKGTVSSAEWNQALSVLGLVGKSSNEEIKSAYRKSLLRVHPDLNRQDPQAEEKTRAVISAYGLLTDEKFRDENVRFHEDIWNSPVNLSISIISPPWVDWIYSTQIGRESGNLYVGCYSGASYIVQNDGTSAKLYDSQAPIRTIREVGRHLYLVSEWYIDILAHGKHIKRVPTLQRFARVVCNKTAFIQITTKEVALFSPTGDPIAQLEFRDNIADAYSAESQLKVITAKKTFLFSVATLPELNSSKESSSFD